MNHGGGRGPKALLDDYAAIARRRGRLALESTALRTRSLGYRDLLAHLASDGSMDLPTLLDAARGISSMDEITQPTWLAALGRVLALQELTPDDRRHAIAVLDLAVPRLTGTVQHKYAKLLAEVLYDAGRFEDVARVLEQHPTVAALEGGYLATDLRNPFTASPYADLDVWRAGFAALFERHGLSAPLVDGDQAVPFDRLRASGTDEHVDGPLVSVIMTTFEPTGDALATSVRSILDQSWRNVEVLVVDDHSTSESAREALDLVAALDRRVRVLRLPENQGTYVARNHGMRAASGEYVTGQDDDDWSHPDRIRRQVEPLIADPALPATRSAFLPAREDLVVQRVGYSVRSPNASSAMYRRAFVEQLGGFLPARKGSDTELLWRAEKVSDRRATTIDEPLAVVRIRAGSLSRADFRAGWQHPARRAYRSAYTRWHEDSQPEDLKLRSGALPVPVPRPFAVEPSRTERLDVVFAGDWRQFGGPQKSMLEEITALTRAGYRVGVLTLEAARFMSAQAKDLCAPVQRLINAGRIVHVLDDEPVEVRLLVLRYPPILQFPPSEPLALKAERFIVLANQAPSERDGTDVRYDPRACADNAERLVGTRALWVPQGPTVRATLHELAPEELAPFDMPGILDPGEWETERAAFRSLRPVIGRHSRANPMKWPASARDLIAAYPVDGSVDVRVMGGAQSALKVLGRGAPPSSWLTLPTDAMPVRTFLNSIDYFVYFQHPAAYDAFGRSVLEALATGCVAILPRHMEPTFGDAALYCDVTESTDLVRELHADPDRYRRQAHLAMRRVRERFSHQNYVELVRRLLDLPSLLPRDTEGAVDRIPLGAGRAMLSPDAAPRVG